MTERAVGPQGSVRRRIEFDGETWHALHRLSLDSMRSLQELADEAIRDLLKKHHRPVTLKDALRQRADVPRKRTTEGHGPSAAPERVARPQAKAVGHSDRRR